MRPSRISSKSSLAYSGIGAIPKSSSISRSVLISLAHVQLAHVAPVGGVDHGLHVVRACCGIHVWASSDRNDILWFRGMCEPRPGGVWFQPALLRVKAAADVPFGNRFCFLTGTGVFPRFCGRFVLWCDFRPDWSGCGQSDGVSSALMDLLRQPLVLPGFALVPGVGGRAG